MDALAFERQFADHLAPVWLALPASVRGRFLCDAGLVDYVRGLGIDAEPVNALDLRRLPQVKAVPDADGPLALCASIGDIKIARRLGYRRHVFLEHGIGQSYGADRSAVRGRNASYPGGIDRDDCVLFLVPNEHSADRWREAYPLSRVEVVGSPRLDSLPRRAAGPGPVVAISFHWPDFLVGNAFGHYRPVLGELAKAVTLIGHCHPKGDWPRRMARQYERLGIKFVPDFADVCRRADLYVCDNSSTIYEFASTGRPVVLLNRPGWDRLNHGLRFGEARDVGLNVYRPDRLVEAVQDALWDAEEQRLARETALGYVYAYRGPEAVRRAVDAVLSVIDEREKVAA